jgi:ligand-binding SRPBCC domain-containing protein
MDPSARKKRGLQDDKAGRYGAAFPGTQQTGRCLTAGTSKAGHNSSAWARHPGIGDNQYVAKTYTLSRTAWVPRPLDAIFDFFSQAGNLQTLTPPFLNFKITDVPPKLRAGALIRYSLRVHGVPVRWVTEITEWNPPHRFVDIQLSGPYKLWRHTHSFVAENGGTTLKDEVQYGLPFGPIGSIVHWAVVERDVNAIFDYRGEKMRELFG